MVYQLENDFGPNGFDCRPAFSNPRQIGPFGKELTDRLTQAVTLDGEKFYVTVEKDPNQ